jgi:antirestriction protein ArdC
MSKAYEKITDQIIKALENGTVPWRKPWNGPGGLPTSMSTGKPYRGVNIMVLALTSMVNGYDSNLWGTYNQIEKQGGQVRKGEKSTAITLWKKAERINAEGEKVESFFMTTFNVFNAEQADGLILPTIEKIEHNSIEEAEKIASAYLTDGPAFSTGGDRAFYSPLTDSIKVPEMGYFSTAEGYYSTLFHEITHSTGHSTRLDRDGVTEGHRFGDADYSKEELVAELGAAFLCAESGIEPDAHLENTTAYIASWLKALKNDPKMVVEAAGKAQKAADLVLGAGAVSEQSEAA